MVLVCFWFGVFGIECVSTYLAGEHSRVAEQAAKLSYGRSERYYYSSPSRVRMMAMTTRGEERSGEERIIFIIISIILLCLSVCGPEMIPPAQPTTHHRLRVLLDRNATQAGWPAGRSPELPTTSDRRRNRRLRAAV